MDFVDMKQFSVKNIGTTLLMVVIILFIISVVFKNNINLYDKDGNPAGTGKLAFKPFWNKK